MKKTGKTIYFSKNIAISNFLFRFVVQQNQFLMANGLQVKNQEEKNKLGFGFDKILESTSEKALVHGTCWGFWNYDHMEKFEAAGDNGARGFFALLDERTSEPLIGIRFWQIDAEKPKYVIVYEVDGFTEYITDKSGTGKITIIKPKVAYRQIIRKDVLGVSIEGGENYDKILPIVPLYANEYHRSEFTPAIKSKIDLYDKIFSDFGDNLERTNDIYWVIKNYGGNEARELLAEIEEYRAVITGDGEDSTAEPHTIEVPYQARQIALELLERALYQDYMAMSMTELTGGSLTNVAIKTAMANMEMKANRFEWQLFQFCQKILALAGVMTENIKFKRQMIANELEIMQMLQICRDDFDLETALNKNPLVEMDEVKIIMERKALEDTGAIDDELELAEGEVSAGQVESAVEETAGKTLTGIQTTSLMAVIERYAAGELTLGQAVNIVSVSIGVTKEEAKRIIEGME